NFDSRGSNFDSRGSNFDSRGSNFDSRTEKETIERNDITKTSKTDETKGGDKPNIVDGIIHFEQKPQSIRFAIKEYFKLNINWDAKYNRQWMEWAVGENITPEQVAQAAETWRSDRRFNWQVPTLKLIFEKWQMLMDAEDSNNEEMTRLL